MTAIRNIIQNQASTTDKLSADTAGPGVRSYRYERKFLVENCRPETVEGAVQLHPAGFYRIYAPRSINNIYLDTPRFLNYRNALDGIASRLKARIRWYGDMYAVVCSPRLEIKGKQGNVSYKSVYPLKNFTVPPKIEVDGISSLLDASPLPPDIRSYLACLRPVLINRYHRKYWRSRNDRYRLTLDHDISFGGFTAFENRALNQAVASTGVILEVKYDLKDDSNFAEIANRFPFRQSRISKYVAGMDQVFQLNQYY